MDELTPDEANDILSNTSNSDDEEMSLAASLRTYHEAIQSEFELDSLDEAAIAKRARQGLYEMLDDAKTAVKQVLLNGKTDSGRINAAKLVYAYTLGEATGTQSGLDRLIDKLTMSPIEPSVEGAKHLLQEDKRED
jgi:hypothetical protein